MTPAEDLHIVTEGIADGVVLRPVGDIDLSRAPSLRVQLNDAQRGGPERLVIDLIDVPYMDSSGVATLLEAMQIARRHHRKLVLCGLQERVRSIFEIARLDTVFVIVDNVEQAAAV